MRQQQNAEEDSASFLTPPVSPKMPWRIAALEVQPDFVIRVRFLDGTEGCVDMHNLVHDENAGVFAALSDASVFGQARIKFGAVTWPGELDLAPDAMYRAIKTAGRWVL